MEAARIQRLLERAAAKNGCCKDTEAAQKGRCKGQEQEQNAKAGGEGLELGPATLFCCSYVKTMSVSLLLLKCARRDRVCLVFDQGGAKTLEELSGEPTAELVAEFHYTFGCMSSGWKARADLRYLQDALRATPCENGWYEMCAGTALQHLAALHGAPKPKPTRTVVKLSQDDRKLLAEGRLHAPGIITLLEKLFDEVCVLKKQLATLQQTAQAQPCPAGEPLEQPQSQETRETELDADCQAESSDCVAPERESEQEQGAMEAALESVVPKEEVQGNLEDPAAPKCKDALRADQECAPCRAEQAMLRETAQTAQTPLQDNVAPEEAAGEGKQRSKVHPADFGDEPEDTLQVTSNWQPDPAFEQRYDDLTDVSSLDGDESPAHKRVKVYAKARRTAKAALEPPQTPSGPKRAREVAQEDARIAPTAQNELTLLLSTAWNGGNWVHLWERNGLPDAAQTEEAPQLAAEELRGLRPQQGRKRRVDDLASDSTEDLPNATAVDGRCKRAEPESKKLRLADLESDNLGEVAGDAANAEGRQEDHALEQRNCQSDQREEAALALRPEPIEPELADLEETPERSSAKLACEIEFELCDKQDARTVPEIRQELKQLLGNGEAHRLLAKYQHKVLRDSCGKNQRYLVDSAGATLTLAQRKNVAPE